jgi:hypothetical protein
MTQPRAAHVRVDGVRDLRLALNAFTPRRRPRERGRVCAGLVERPQAAAQARDGAVRGHRRLSAMQELHSVGDAARLDEGARASDDDTVTAALKFGAHVIELLGEGQGLDGALIL